MKCLIIAVSIFVSASAVSYPIAAVEPPSSAVEPLPSFSLHSPPVSLSVLYRFHRLKTPPQSQYDSLFTTSPYKPLEFSSPAPPSLQRTLQMAVHPASIYWTKTRMTLRDFCSGEMLPSTVDCLSKLFKEIYDILYWLVVPYHEREWLSSHLDPQQWTSLVWENRFEPEQYSRNMAVILLWYLPEADKSIERMQQAFQVAQRSQHGMFLTRGFQWVFEILAEHLQVPLSLSFNLSLFLSMFPAQCVEKTRSLTPSEGAEVDVCGNLSPGLYCYLLETIAFIPAFMAPLKCSEHSGYLHTSLRIPRCILGLSHASSRGRFRPQSFSTSRSHQASRSTSCSYHLDGNS